MFIHLQSCVSSQESLPVPCILCPKQQQQQHHQLAAERTSCLWLAVAGRKISPSARSFVRLLVNSISCVLHPPKSPPRLFSQPPRVKYQSAFNFIVRPIQFTRGCFEPLTSSAHFPRRQDICRRGSD